MSENELAAIVAEMRTVAPEQGAISADLLRWADELESLSARPAWLTELIAAGERLKETAATGTHHEYCKAEVALTRAALAIPQEGK